MRYNAGHQKRFREEALRHAIAAVAAFLAILTLLPGRAAAEWPDKPVRVIVPYAAGGANDLLGRVFAEQLSKALPFLFIIEQQKNAEGIYPLNITGRLSKPSIRIGKFDLPI